jgi:hypothetical protein
MISDSQHSSTYELDFLTSPELYALGYTHFDHFARQRPDLVFVEPLTRCDGF